MILFPGGHLQFNSFGTYDIDSYIHTHTQSPNLIRASAATINLCSNHYILSIMLLFNCARLKQCDSCQADQATAVYINNNSSEAVDFFEFLSCHSVAQTHHALTWLSLTRCVTAPLLAALGANAERTVYISTWCLTGSWRGTGNRCSRDPAVRPAVQWL